MLSVLILGKATNNREERERKRKKRKKREKRIKYINKTIKYKK
jgi:hypothetical protein